MSSYKEISQAWAVKQMVDLENAYISRGQKASGQFGDSIEDKIEVNDYKISIEILGAKQIGIMQKGRIPNKNQTPEKLIAWVGWAGSTFLKNWVKDKSLSISPYAVAWKIAKEGITVPNRYNDGMLLNSVFTKDSIEDLTKEIGAYSLKEFTSKYMKAWQ